MANREWHKLQCYVYCDGNYAHAKNPLHEKLNAPLCERMEQIRNDEGWSMKEFAMRMNVSLYMLHEIVHGRAFPRYVHLLNLQSMTGVKIDEWMALCVDGFRFSLKNRMIQHPKYFISWTGGHLTLVERHKP